MAISQKSSRSMTVKLQSAFVVARGFAITGALFCMVAAVIALRWGWADALAQPVLKTQASWQRSFAATGQIPSVIEWQLQYDSLRQAQALEPQNPAWMEAKSRLLSMPVGSENSSTYAVTAMASRTISAADKAMPNQHDAIAEQLNAIASRPVSAYSWANLVALKYQAGQIDSAFYGALENAAKLGPWEPEVQFVVIDLGFAMWDEMPKSVQPVIDKMVANASLRYAVHVAEIAAKRGRLSLVCSSEKLAKMKICLTSRLSAASG
jgi:hypothetical protein